MRVAVFIRAFLMFFLLVNLSIIHKLHAIGLGIMNDEVMSFASTETGSKKLSYKDLSKNVARDHLLIQTGYENWAKVHSDAMGGFHRQVFLAGMYDLIIKGFPYMSVGIGLGAGWDNFYFKNALLNIDADLVKSAEVYGSSRDFYDKSKIALVYGQFPIELRYTSNPLNYNKGLKLALGVKLGYLLQAYTKAVEHKDSQGQIISKAKLLVRDRRLFSDFQAWGTFRIGWGNFHLYANYSLFPIFKLNSGPQAQVWGVGIGISGL